MSAQPYIYVANTDSGSVSVLNARANQVVATLIERTPSGFISPDVLFFQAQEVAVGRDARYVYIRAWSWIAILEAATNRLVGRIDGLGPGGTVALSPDNGTLYVPGGGGVKILDSLSGIERTAPIATGVTASRLRLARDGAHLFVNTNGDGTLFVDLAARTSARLFDPTLVVVHDIVPSLSGPSVYLIAESRATRARTIKTYVPVPGWCLSSGGKVGARRSGA